MSKARRRLVRKRRAIVEKTASKKVDVAKLVLDQALPVEDLTPEQLAERSGEDIVEEPEVIEELELEKKPEPITFEEVEEARAIVAQKEEVGQLLKDAELITDNIFSSELTAKEQADAMRQLSGAFYDRVHKAFGDEDDADEGEDTSDDNGGFDFDVAELKMLLLQDEQSLAEKAVNLLENIKPGRKDSLPHVRNEMARAARQIQSGGAGADEAREALPEIRAAAKKLGIGVPSEKNANSVVVLKDKDGNFRWFGWVSNNFKDRDNQIITDEAHKEYVAWLDKNPKFAPTFRVWHTKGTDREAQADWWAYDNGFLMMSGPLTEKEATALMTVASKEKLGMSHGFLGAVKDKKFITWYRSFEVSDLPVSQASNPWTDIETLGKEKEMDTKKSAYISAQLGEDFLKTIEVESAEKQEALRLAGVEEKEVKDETKTAEPQELSAVLAAVAKEFGLKELSDWVKTANAAVEKVSQLEITVAELQKTDDEKIAKAITPPAQATHLAWMQRQSEANDNKVTDKTEDKELEKESVAHWFTEVASLPAQVQ